MTTDRVDAEPTPAARRWSAYLGLAVGIVVVVVAVAVGVVFFDPPSWFLWIGVGLLVAATVVSVPLAHRRARRQGRSRRRSVWQGLTAPVRQWLG